MNIAIITPVFHPSVGGVQAVAAAYARRLAAKGCNVTVITSAIRTPFRWFLYDEPPLPRRDEMDGVRVVRVRPRWRALWRALFWLSQLKIRGGYRLLSALMGRAIDVFQGPWIRIRSALEDSRPDVQIVIWPYFRAVHDVMALKRERGIPWIVVPVFHSGHERAEGSLLRMLLAADWVVCLTPIERDEFVAAGVPSVGIGILGCGVDRVAGPGESICPPGQTRDIPHGFRVCYLGRLDPAKGVKDLIAAGRLFLDDRVDTCLVLMGASCPETPAVMAELDVLPRELRDRVAVIRDFPEADRGALLSGMDVVVLPSTAESFGIAVIEAWARRKPVIVCAGTASACLLNECDGGLAYLRGDARALADAVLRLKSEPALARAMGEAGHRLVMRKYTWDAIVESLFQKCQALVSSRKERA